MGKNYYEILEVSPSANLQVIKKQYLILVRLLHPDRIHEDDVKSYGEEKLKLINEAYQVLRDPRKRVEYDRKLRASNESSNSSQTGYSTQSSKYSHNEPSSYSNRGSSSTPFTKEKYGTESSDNAPSSVASPPDIMNSSTFKTLIVISIVTYFFGGLIFLNANGMPSSDQFWPMVGIVAGGIIGAWIYYSNFGGNKEKELDIFLGLLSGLGVILIVAVAIWLIVVIFILGLFARVIADEFK